MNIAARGLLNRSSNRAWVALFVAAVAVVILSTRVFDDFAPVRLTLIEGRRVPVDEVVRVGFDEPTTQPSLKPPLAFMMRAVGSSQSSRRLSVTVDGLPVCLREIAGARSQRVDCVVRSWNASSTHVVAIASDTSGPWTVEHVEMATYHGNNGGPHRFYVVPKASQNYGRPSIGWILGLVAAVFQLCLVQPRVSSAPLRISFAVLRGMVLALLAALLVLPWVSPYLVIISFGTAARWAALAMLPEIVEAWRWLVRTKGSSLPNARLARSALMGLLVALVFGTVVHTQLRERFNGNYSGFLKVARSFFDRNPLLNQNPDLKASLLLGDDGYDGQLMYAAAFDPFLRKFKDPSVYTQVMGEPPAYRYGRIGFPVLTDAFSLGRWQLFPTVMMWLVFCSLWLCGSVVAWLAQEEGRSAALAGLVLLVPGFWFSLQTALPEPVSGAMLLAGFACLYRRKSWVAAAFFAAALLVRETGGIAVAVALGGLFWRGRRREAVLAAVIAFGPLLLWRSYVAWILWPVWGTDALFYRPPSDRPLAGILTMWRLIGEGTYWPHVPQMILSAKTFPVLLFVGIGISALFLLRRTPEIGLAGLLYGVNAVSLDYSAVWAHVANAERTTYEMFILLILGTTLGQPLSGRARTALVGFWCAVAVYMMWGTLEAESIRRSVLQQLLYS